MRHFLDRLRKLHVREDNISPLDNSANAPPLPRHQILRQLAEITSEPKFEGLRRPNPRQESYELGWPSRQEMDRVLQASCSRQIGTKNRLWGLQEPRASTVIIL